MPGFNSMWTMNFQMFSWFSGFRKGRETRDQIANIHWIIEKAREFQKNIYSRFIDILNYSKAFDLVKWSEVAQSCPTLCHPMDYRVHGILQAKITGLGSLSLLQGIFPTQGSKPGLPHCRQILYQLSHQRSPRILEGVAYPFSRGSSQPRNWTGVSCKHSLYSESDQSLCPPLPGPPFILFELASFFKKLPWTLLLVYLQQSCVFFHKEIFLLAAKKETFSPGTTYSPEKIFPCWQIIYRHSVPLGWMSRKETQDLYVVLKPQGSATRARMGKRTGYRKCFHLFF